MRNPRKASFNWLRELQALLEVVQKAGASEWENFCDDYVDELAGGRMSEHFGGKYFIPIDGYGKIADAFWHFLVSLDDVIVWEDEQE